MKYLIDSGIFFDYFKNNSVSRPIVLKKLMQGHTIVLFCLIRYEVLRGKYKAISGKQKNDQQKEAERQRIVKFELLASQLEGVSDLPPDFIDRAASLYGEIEGMGMSDVPTNDILLVTVARDGGYTVVSTDRKHLQTLSQRYQIPFERWT